MALTRFRHDTDLADLEYNFDSLTCSSAHSDAKPPGVEFRGIRLTLYNDAQNALVVVDYEVVQDLLRMQDEFEKMKTEFKTMKREFAAIKEHLAKRSTSLADLEQVVVTANVT
jgi:hypothetical protein